MAYFVNECDGESFLDKLVEISPVAAAGSATTLYGLLCGAAGYAGHYGQHGKKNPNAVLVADPTQGANDGMLRLMVRTSNESPG